jgi:hypothetical protein
MEDRMWNHGMFDQSEIRGPSLDMEREGVIRAMAERVSQREGNRTSTIDEISFVGSYSHSAHCDGSNVFNSNAGVASLRESLLAHFQGR